VAIYRFFLLAEAEDQHATQARVCAWMRVSPALVKLRPGLRLAGPRAIEAGQNGAAGFGLLV
jgi:hypothetical protein